MIKLRVLLNKKFMAKSNEKFMIKLKEKSEF